VVPVSVVDSDEIGDQDREAVVEEVDRCNLENMEEVDRWNGKNECLSTHLDQGGVVLHEAETGTKSGEE